MIDLLLLTHSEESTTGTTPDWCRARGLSFEAKFSQNFFDEKQSSDYKALIVFGGDMEAWETDKHPWLKREKEFIRDFIRDGKPVFGICLGSQLLAEQLGADVKPIGYWEFGWYPVRLEDGRTLTPLHCHSSMFTLPSEAIRTASDAIDSNQGFRARSKYVGYQFHTEIDQTRIEHITAALAENSPKGRVQSKKEILDGFRDHAENLKSWYFSELDAWWNQATSPAHPSQD